MWQSRTKNELIIEVWEKLDCENVGAAEIEAIETVVSDVFGPAAVDSPMILARLLADEGAELRHSEVMALYLKRASDRPYDGVFRNILQLTDLRSSLNSINALENLRRKFKAENDKEGLRLLREKALGGKRSVNEIAEKHSTDEMKRQINIEISQWLSVWLQTPEFFPGWVELRQASKEFVERFGQVRPAADE